jgi:hypothetical protein
MSLPKILSAAVIAPALIAAAPAAQTAQSAAPAKTAKTAKVDPNQVICKKFPPPVGTRVGSRQICKTQAEWDMIDRNQEEVMEEVQNRSPLTSN